jgi:hypothetical protein
VAFSRNVLKTLIEFMILGMNVSIVEKEKPSRFVGQLFAPLFVRFSYGAILLTVSAEAR